MKISVLVVGGGPSGMQAARVAALRGHDVTLWEKTSQLGGHLVPVSVPDFKRDTRHLLQFLSGQLETLGVNVVLEKEATLDSIQTMNPDALIIAAGSTIAKPRYIPGIEKQLVLPAFDVLTGTRECAKRVAVIGGGLTGCELALYLSQKGNEITIVEAGPTVLPDEFECNRQDLLYLFQQQGVTVFTAARPVEITDTGLVIETKSGKKTLNVDNVILASGFQPDTGLTELLESQHIRFTPIGDCIVPRKRLKTLLWGGFYAARSI